VHAGYLRLQTHSEYVIFIVFSTAKKIVARKPPNITSYVTARCPPYFHFPFVCSKCNFYGIIGWPGRYNPVTRTSRRVCNWWVAEGVIRRRGVMTLCCNGRPNTKYCPRIYLFLHKKNCPGSHTTRYSLFQLIMFPAIFVTERGDHADVYSVVIYNLSVFGTDFPGVHPID